MKINTSNQLINSISFKILPSPESNDHEVRIFINGNDLLGKDHLGLDPPSFFSQPNFFTGGKIMIGRCTCGCEGCSVFFVAVDVQETVINWTNGNELTIDFQKSDYTKSITDAKHDYSWEDINRRVERLVSEILKNTQTKESQLFQWASARIKNGTITVSYGAHYGVQTLFEIPWSQESIDSGIANAKIFLTNNF